MKTKHYLSLFIVAAALQACSSDSDSNSEAKCQCGDNEKCYEDVCYPVDACKPDCTGTDKCYKGQCIKQDQCAPDCKEDEKCYQGTCYSIDVCKPDCTGDYECVNGECQLIDTTKCTGTQCKSQTEYCDETGHWAECAAGEGCHLGYCLEGLAPECKDGECHDSANKKCSGGKWKACGSLEQCVNGECEITSEACETGTCSEDKEYRCTDEQKYEKCGLGSECFDGQCVSNYNRNDAMLWQTCSKNSDCAFGACIFEISTSNRFTSIGLNLEDVNTIPVSALDSRIEPGMGICSADCTQSASICDTLTEAGSSVKFTCQVMAVGDSPYPPTNNEGLALTLPFHKELDFELMSIASYAAACRPNDAGEYYYSKKFCKNCATSDDCGTNEVCDLGMCLNTCSSSEMCPIGFSCKPVSGSEQSVCMPKTQTCGSCVDLDGDGQGFGHCEKAGFDCDDLDPTTYYTTDAPVACTDTSDDKNCNGIIDRFELLGSEDYCSSCEETCYPGSEAKHFTRACILNNGDRELDDYTPDTFTFECKSVCAAGFADCDGDLTNGCEVQIANIKGSTATATSNGELYALDADKDNYGTTDTKEHHFCCKTQTSVCYAMPNTTTNTSTVWNKATLDSSKQYVKNATDCADNDATVNPGKKDICNGKDDDCNAATADGSASTFTDKNGKSYNLGTTCSVYNSSTGSLCSTNGVVQCSISSSGKAEMICYNKDKTSDEKAASLICNGKDDNCNGQIDEDWNYPQCDTGKKGICSLGILLCSGGTTSCYQLYQPRTYDFYGDGVDSNCDGYDYDVNHAIFVENYGTGSEDGRDTNAGTITSQKPVASLAKAIDLACGTGSPTYYCNDIFLSSKLQSSDYWGKDDVSIPTYSSKWSSGVNTEITFAEHVKNYKAKGSSYNANAYLYQGEVYAPKHALRIYGGMSRNGVTLTKSSGSTTSYERARTEYGNADERTLLWPNPKTRPVSLAIHDVNFTVTAPTTAESLKNAGVTVAGLQCGGGGCRELLLDHTTFTITAPNGVNHSTDEYDKSSGQGPYIWSDYNREPMKPVRAHNDVWRFNNAHTNYENYMCIRDEQHGGDNKDFYTYKDSAVSSLFNAKCPDGRQPLGGCGGIVCSKSNCGDLGSGTEHKNGHDGEGYYEWVGSTYTGKGTTFTSCDKGNGCDSNTDQSGDKTWASAGADGANGPGGAGGSSSDISMYVTKDSSSFVYVYSDPSGGAGKPGTSGGGGGGGGVYRAWSKDGSEDSGVLAASGGAGGCGGRGGVAGGTGGTAIGLVLVPPSSGTADIQFINGTYFTVTGGAGGSSQKGEDGLKGTDRGDWFAYARESSGSDRQCQRSSGSGAGGAGGGGGAGAGGRAGHAYGVVFHCNRSVSGFTNGNTDKLADCGFSVTADYLKSPTSFATAKSQADKASGNSGSAGSTAGTTTLGGSGGSSSSSTGKTNGASGVIYLY